MAASAHERQWARVAQSEAEDRDDGYGNGRRGTGEYCRVRFPIPELLTTWLTTAPIEVKQTVWASDYSPDMSIFDKTQPHVIQG